MADSSVGLSRGALLAAGAGLGLGALAVHLWHNKAAAAPPTSDPTGLMGQLLHLLLEGRRQEPADAREAQSDDLSHHEGGPAGRGRESGPAGVWEGFSMEQARKHADKGEAEMAIRTPAQVLEDLQRGNARFWMGRAKGKHASAFERRALIMKQYPSCAILGCSDSRVPIEIVFDQGLGDMFVIRVAGNCLSAITRGSIEYAVHHLKVKVLVVMGHEGCGAVKTAQLPANQIAQLAPNLSNVHDPTAKDREAVVTNVIRQVEALATDEAIMAKVKSRELIVLGAFYEISSGIVDFFHEVSQVGPADAAGEDPDGDMQPSRGVQTRYDFEKNSGNSPQPESATCCGSEH